MNIKILDNPTTPIWIALKRRFQMRCATRYWEYNNHQKNLDSKERYRKKNVMACRKRAKDYQTIKRKTYQDTHINSLKNTGFSSVHWKGGKIKVNGYYYIYCKKEGHPFITKGGYVAEHRLVIENEIRRFLLPSEIVHHIDENKLNNSLSNLELLENQSVHSSLHNETRSRDPNGRFEKGRLIRE